MDTVTAISHSFHLLVSCRFLAWTNLNVLEELTCHLAEETVKTTKSFDYNGIL